MIRPTRPAPTGINNTALGILCGMGAGALWGFVFVAPELVRDFSPLQIAVGRYVAYGLISAILIRPRWLELTCTLTGRDWLMLMSLATAGNILYFVLLSAAVQKAGIAPASLVIGFLPVIVTIAGSRAKGAVSLRALTPSLLLCGSGALCVGWRALEDPGVGSGGDHLLGLLYAFGALGSWSAYAVFNTRSLARLPRISARDWTLLTGVVTGAQALLLAPVTLLSGPVQHTLPSWALLAMVSIGLAVAASIIASALWNRMSRLLPLTMVGQMILFETLFALIYGFLWERRLPLPVELAAAAFVVAGVLACIRAHRPSRASSAFGAVPIGE
ncbi:DMT family transporter [Sphingomonas sp. OTU376]|uniref:DMT family transporter n=1 Tax=Sphingomonas sp. OTU376 TaxID=3043863 RepID=UPI00313CE6D3